MLLYHSGRIDLTHIIFFGGFVMSIADVREKGSFYEVYDVNQKRISYKHIQSIGELCGFSDRIIVVEKDSHLYVYDEDWRQISYKHKSVGDFKNIIGENILFIRDNYIYTYDKKFNQINYKHI